MSTHLTIQHRALAQRLRANGMSLRDITKRIGCSQEGIDIMRCGQQREGRSFTWTPLKSHGYVMLVEKLTEPIALSA